MSIPKKIVVIAMIISASALLVASGAVLGYDYIVARENLRSNTMTLARIVADNTSAAVAFNDKAAAVDTLNALHAEPSIVLGCIYMGDALFAQHVSGRDVQMCSPRLSSDPSDGDLVWTAAPIEVKGKQIGTVELGATLGPTYGRLRFEIAIIAVILLMSALFALALSARLHKFVSEPILRLARTADEVSRHQDYSIRAAKQGEGELATLANSFNDMLAQIQLRTAALAKANQELQNANKMKDEFLATLSHELRTPLTSIFGWVNLMRQGRLDEEKTAKAVDVIDRNVRAQIQLVDDLLNVSQIITGKLKIHTCWTNAGTIVRAALDSIQPAAAAKNIEIAVNLPDSEERVFADPERIQQVLWNLLTNAVKFSEKGGRVCLEAGRVGTAFRISVSDSGEGIDPEFMPFLFERFTQADASKTRKHGGLGLGLAIVRHIVESHGGTVTAQSKGKGQGATFTIHLPIPANTA
ncbi:MAG TPA: ATP-binding protein [Terriglobia bacterium]|nr:ATP-binding protein [Terriglobia bacterium]